MLIRFFSFSLLSAVVGLTLSGQVMAEEYCANASQEKAVAEFYQGRPGAQPMIPGRRLSMPEQIVISAVPNPARVYGVAATPERVKETWATIDAWGEKTTIRFIFTMGGMHVADFPTLVPVTQPDDGSGFLDIYADEGRGVHAHLYLDLVKAIYAAEIPGQDGSKTRMVSFYGGDGNLIAGAYASIAGKDADQKAIEAFPRSLEKVKSWPQLCR